MFAAGSRYAGLEVRHIVLADTDGTTRSVPYVVRRVLPRLDDHAALAVHRVAPGERLDALAARYVSDPTRFWMICDANPVIRPSELDVPGRSFIVAMPRR